MSITKMDFTLILKNVAKHIDLNEEEKSYFLSIIGFKKIEKKTLFLAAGQEVRYLSMCTLVP